MDSFTSQVIAADCQAIDNRDWERQTNDRCIEMLS